MGVTMKVKITETWDTYNEIRETSQTHFELTMSGFNLCHVINVNDPSIGVQAIVVPTNGMLELEAI